MATLNKKPQSPSNPRFSSLKTFLISSVNFWFALSIVSSILSLVFFSSTNLYTTHFARLGTLTFPLTAAIAISVRSFIFLFHNAIRTLIAEKGPRGRYSKICATVLLWAWAFSLIRYPEYESVASLCLVMSTVVDILAIVRLIRLRVSIMSPIHFHITSAATERVCYLYGNQGYWLMIYVVVFAIFWVNTQVDSWIDDDIKKKKEAQESAKLADKVL